MWHVGSEGFADDNCSFHMKVVESFTVMHSRQNPHYIYKRISRWAAMYYLARRITIGGIWSTSGSATAYDMFTPTLRILPARSGHEEVLPANDFLTECPGSLYS